MELGTRFNGAWCKVQWSKVQYIRMCRPMLTYGRAYPSLMLWSPVTRVYCWIGRDVFQKRLQVLKKRLQVFIKQLYVLKICQHVQCTRLPCSAYLPSLFIASLPHWSDIPPSSFILSFYIKQTDYHPVKYETTSPHSRSGICCILSHTERWECGLKGGWKEKRTTGFYCWGI